MRDYNSYGRLSDRVLDDIQKGDTVQFSYHKVLPDKITNRPKNTEVLLVGIWDGEKVCFDDKEQTIVKTKEWLKKL